MEKENIDYQTLNDSSKCESFSKINVLSFTENGKKFICNPNLQKQYVFSIKNDKIISIWRITANLITKEKESLR